MNRYSKPSARSTPATAAAPSERSLLLTRFPYGLAPSENARVCAADVQNRQPHTVSGRQCPRPRNARGSGRFLQFLCENSLVLPLRIPSCFSATRILSIVFLILVTTVTVHPANAVDTAIESATAVETTDSPNLKTRFPEVWNTIWSATDLNTWQKTAAEEAIALAIELASDPVMGEYFLSNLQLTSGVLIAAIKRNPLGVVRTSTESIGTSVAKGLVISLAANVVADAILHAEAFDDMDSTTKAVLHGLIAGTLRVGMQTADDFRSGGLRAAVIKGSARRVVDLVEIYFATASVIAAEDRAFIAVALAVESSVELEMTVRTKRGQSIAAQNLRDVRALVPAIYGRDDTVAVQKIVDLAAVALRQQAQDKPDAARSLANEILRTGRLENNIHPFSLLTKPLDYITAAANWGRDAPQRAAEIIISTTQLSKLIRSEGENQHAGTDPEVERLRAVLGREPSATAKDENGWTDLHYAAALNLPRLVSTLVDAGADVAAPLKEDNIPLSDRLKRIATDLGLKFKRGRDGSEPLHVAAGENARDAAAELIERGGNINSHNSFGATPLHYAAAYNALEVAVELIERGASISIRSQNKYGHTPLHWAAMRGALEVAVELIERGASINSQDKNDQTPLHVATRYDAREVAVELIERGASINSQDKNDQTPLHVATRYDAREVAVELIERGASIHSQDKDGHTPLQRAAMRGALEVAVELIERGASIHSPDKDGRTPLHWAAISGTRAMALALELIAHGADVHAKDKKGRTPFDLAGRDLRRAMWNKWAAANPTPMDENEWTVLSYLGRRPTREPNLKDLHEDKAVVSWFYKYSSSVLVSGEQFHTKTDVGRHEIDAAHTIAEKACTVYGRKPVPVSMDVESLFSGFEVSLLFACVK